MFVQLRDQSERRKRIRDLRVSETWAIVGETGHKIIISGRESRHKASLTGQARSSVTRAREGSPEMKAWASSSRPLLVGGIHMQTSDDYVGQGSARLLDFQYFEMRIKTLEQLAPYQIGGQLTQLVSSFANEVQMWREVCGSYGAVIAPLAGDA